MGAVLEKSKVLASLRVRDVIAALDIRGRSSGREFRMTVCPTCGPRSRDSVSINLATGRWRCFAHQCSGDLLAFLALHAGLRCSDQFAEVLALAQRIAGTSGPSKPVVAARTSRDRPRELKRAKQEVPRLWDQLPGLSASAAAYIATRGLASLVGRRDIVRGTPLPRVMTSRWHETVSSILSVPSVVVPTYDLEDGTMCNLTSRRLHPGTRSKVMGLPAVPKMRGHGTPVGTFGRWRDYQEKPRDVVLVEGVFDYLTARQMFPAQLVLGVDGGDLLAGVVRQIATAIHGAGRSLLLVPHNDAAGEKSVGAAVVVAVGAGLRLGRGLQILDVTA